MQISDFFLGRKASVSAAGLYLGSLTHDQLSHMRFLSILILTIPSCVQAQTDSVWLTPFERSGGLASATYDEAIAYYQDLADVFPEVAIRIAGLDDSGEPIYLVLIDGQQQFAPQPPDQVFFLINNGIHAGESCGVDACMMLARDLVREDSLRPLLQHVMIGIIPVYNVSGSENRRCCTRANQVGPREQGFRGNARNLDLNRDFLKADSRNARAFAEVFQVWTPELFLDTHTTNGADYQAPITLLPTYYGNLQSPAREYFRYNLVPDLYATADSAGLLLSPYVNTFNAPPEAGMAAFLDLPRYSTGYTSLFQTLGFMSEAHMLKPFATRVAATRQLIELMLGLGNRYYREIGAVVASARLQAGLPSTQEIAWTLDTTVRDSVLFYGYAASRQPGAVTGAPRLHYDRTQPWTAYIPYFPAYRPTRTVAVPDSYVIPAAWTEVIERLRTNEVEIEYLPTDSALTVEVYYLESAAAETRPYEGHYYHDEVRVQTDTQTLRYRQGDAIVRTRQWRRPYLVHALEPAATDSWFRWNFFDGILQQKEYFSPYLFEDLAADLLEQDPALRAAFDTRKANDPTFAQDPQAQLTYIYQHSAYYEPSHRRYPVGRLFFR